MPSTKLNSVSTEELRGEIRRRQRRLDTLHRRRERLASQVREIEDAILKEGGEMTALSGRKRPRNTKNLADSLVDLLATKTMSVTEASEKVQAAGYRTTSPNFRTIVNQTLLKDKRFKRVGRGLYTSKRGGAKKKTAGKKKRTRRSAR